MYSNNIISSVRKYFDCELYIIIIKAAIEMAGYEWFLTNVVNNGNGGWPLAIGSEKFVEANFDMAEVAGNLYISVIE